jgi:unsaturated rhamnogalacturonyl hydrolase
MAETIMKTYPDSIVVKRAGEKIASRPTSWDYEQGVVLKGFDLLYQQTHEEKYLAYMKKIIDNFVQPDGSIRTYDITDYNSDDITPGRIVLSLYAATGEEKYKKAAYALREQLKWQPRTKEGGFWHKHRYPYQMWLDGLYMYGPFYAEFAKTFKESQGFTDVANQFIWMEKHARDAKTGLIYHGWDESKKQRWANPETGLSPEFWGRSIGWYAIALADVLDYFPKEHDKQKEIVAIFQRLAVALKKYQDPASGVWYQIVDKAGVKGNYLEASASCMFTYALAKGARLGYLDKSYAAVAKKGFEGLIKNFIEKDDNGLIHLTKSVSVGGLGGNPYRDGSYEYYLSEPLRTDDLKGVGPFIEASVEIELID